METTIKPVSDVENAENKVETPQTDKGKTCSRTASAKGKTTKAKQAEKSQKLRGKHSGQNSKFALAALKAKANQYKAHASTNNGCNLTSVLSKLETGRSLNNEELAIACTVAGKDKTTIKRMFRERYPEADQAFLDKRTNIYIKIGADYVAHAKK